MRQMYTAQVERDGRFWLITITELDCVTQARFPAEIEDMARDLVAITTEVETDSFDLQVVGSIA